MKSSSVRRVEIGREVEGEGGDGYFRFQEGGDFLLEGDGERWMIEGR